MDCEKKFDELVTATGVYLAKNDIQNVVIGLSGGIDSTLSTIILYEVLKRNPGRFKILGVSLPSSTSTHEELTTAAEVGKVFCTRFIVDNIDNLVKEFGKIIEQYYPYDEAVNNLKARIRTTILYDIANNEGHAIVIDNSNITERNLGLWAVNGENGDLNIISNLWKHEIYELAVYVYERLKGNGEIQQSETLFKSISLEPSDGAVKDMTKISENLNYAKIDEILEVFINKIKPYYDIIDEPVDPADPEFSLKIQAIYTLRTLNDKYGEEDVQKVINMYQNSEYKRRRYPKIIR